MDERSATCLLYCCTQEDVKQKQPLKSYWIKLGDPIEKEFLQVPPKMPRTLTLFMITVTAMLASRRERFLSNSCYIRKTGSMQPEFDL